MHTLDRPCAHILAHILYQEGKCGKRCNVVADCFCHLREAPEFAHCVHACLYIQSIYHIFDLQGHNSLYIYSSPSTRCGKSHLSRNRGAFYFPSVRTLPHVLYQRMVNRGVPNCSSATYAGFPAQLSQQLVAVFQHPYPSLMEPVYPSLMEPVVSGTKILRWTALPL